MASSAETVPKAARPSFARIAAAGIQPPSAQQNSESTSHSAQHSSAISPLPNGPNNDLNTKSSHEPTGTAQQAQLSHIDGTNLQEPGRTSSAGPEVHIEAVDGTSTAKEGNGPEGLLSPNNVDETGTLVSSCDGDGKPSSSDGKSVASGTTFALDEKESLRPDDSASVQASAEDDDLGYPPGTGAPTSRLGSEDGVRAFRDQLHEIHAMEPARRPQTGAGAEGSARQGVLYVPPEGSGIGSVPRPNRQATVTADSGAAVPDTKLLEALENPRDRIWVLKLEQDVIDFVKDAKESSLNLPQCNSFYRMLAHKMADYYMLGHSVDDSNSAVRLYRTPHCRIPQPLTGVVTPSTAASTPPPAGPQIKLLRRGIDPGPAIANGSNMNSKTNSDEESGDDKKKPVSREEREARYEAARLRIMGSAKPTESEIVKEKDESRSSSAAGKRSKKKQRDNSDDGFEARSAYSSFFAPTYSSNGGYTSQPVAYQNPQGANASQFTPSPYTNPELGGMPQYGAQNAGQQWGASAYPGGDGNQSWYQSSQSYDLSKNFTQAMSFQTPQAMEQQQTTHSPYAQGYMQQSYASPNPWQQHGFGASQQPTTGFGSTQGFPDRNPMSGYTPQMQQHQPHQQQNYPFGQLPSQNMGRAPNALEHPLPGSWKSPHFNPQSQAFVPGPATNPSFRPFTPQRQTAGANNGGPQGMQYPLERQMSSHSQGSSFGSPHHAMHAAGGPPRMPTQPLTHPLPQPVFPRQPSPNVPLPPKPMSGPLLEQARHSPSAANQMSPQNSSIAKWGAPASLPAKPPPSAEPFDASRFNPAQRTPAFNSAAAARLPGGGLSGYGPM